MQTKIKTAAIKLQLTNEALVQTKVEDNVIAEVPVALVYNGISHAVMMAMPQNLEDFALGFSLNEGIISNKSEIYGMDIVPQCEGVEVQIEMATRCFVALKEKRRAMTGRTGCGICGVEQLEQVNQSRQLAQKNDRLQQVNPHILAACLAQLEQAQTLAQETGASHAAAFFSLDGKLLAIREDVGRHVALDKLIGWHAKQNQPQGFVLVSSRASYEMVQKSVACGIELLVAISAATDLAVNMAEQYNLSLIGFARPGKANIYAGKERFVLA